MVPNPYGIYDERVRARTLWAVREGLILAGILLFWVAVAALLSVVLFVLSIPLVFLRFGAPGLPIIGLVWTLVAPLAGLTAFLYVLVRAGTVIVDHYRSDADSTFEDFVGVERRPGRARATDAVVNGGVDDTDAGVESDTDDESDGDDDSDGDHESDGDDA